MIWRFGRKTEDPAPRAVYETIVAAARQPALYIEHEVPDTLEGRYEMLVLHLFLYLHRLRDEDEAARAFGQKVFDTMFADMDRSLREIGVGDLSVPKKIKKMAQVFYGRTAAFDPALEGEDAGELRTALKRNVYPEHEAADRLAEGLAAYMSRARRALSGQPVAALVSSGAVFPDAAAPVPGEAAS